MTAKLQQRQRKRPAQTERGFVTRSNAAHPPAYHLDQRIQPRKASRSVPIHRDSLGTYGYYPQLDFSYPPRGELSVRSTWLHLSVGKRRFRPQHQRTGALHDAGALAVPLKIAHLDRGSVTRSNAAHPSVLFFTIAFNNPQRLGPRWQPAAPKRSEGGSAAATPLSPAQHIPELSRPLARTIRHSSFAFYWQAGPRPRHSSPQMSSRLCNTTCNTEINSN